MHLKLVELMWRYNFINTILAFINDFDVILSNLRIDKSYKNSFIFQMFRRLDRMYQILCLGFFFLLVKHWPLVSYLRSVASSLHILKWISEKKGNHRNVHRSPKTVLRKLYEICQRSISISVHLKKIFLEAARWKYRIKNLLNLC